jgi:translocation and assembly module TamA
MRPMGRRSRDGYLKRLGFSLVLTAAVLVQGRALAAERQAAVEGVSDRALRAEIERAITEEKTAPASRIDARRRARAAADSATALLRSEGYYDYEVTPDLVGEGEHPEPVVKIDPGPQSKIANAAIQWTGEAPPAPAEAAAEKALKLPTGSPGRAADVIAAEGRALSAIQQLGYADAKLSARDVVVDHADHTVNPTFKIAAGALVRMDGIQIDSKGRTRRAWLNHLIPWKTRDIYDPKKVAELERRLLDTQVYDSVTVALAPKPNADGLRPVIVSLSDRARNTLDASAGYSTTEGGDIDLKLSRYNRFGVGDTLTYELRYGAIDSRAGVEWALPNFWRPGQTLTTDADFFQTVTNAYRETGAQVLGDLTQRYGKTTYFTRGASVTASQVEDFETGVINIVTLRLLGAFALDKSDNPLDPHRGYKIEARAEPTLITEDENRVYLKVQGQISYYLPLDLFGDTVIATRLHVGSILGGGTEVFNGVVLPNVPASDRFYAGGGGSVRGYDYQNVGPHFADNTPVGGLSLAEASFELRRQIRGPIGGVLFFDTGTVSEQIEPDFRHTLSAVGVGLRYNLGFAPIRADLAFPLQKPNGASQQAFQIYLSIGQSF